MTLSITQTSRSALRVEADATLVNLSASDVERLIAELAKFRRNMTPEVPRKIPDGRVEGQTVDPIFVLQSVVDQKVLSLRHPGIGWLMFLLPEAEAQKLGHGLVQKLPGMSNPPGAMRRH